MFQRILLATDGSPASEAATRLAAGLARQHGAALTAVFVIDLYPYAGVGEAGMLGFDAYRAAARDHADRAHARVAEIVGRHGGGLQPAMRRLEDIGAADGILQVAQEEGSDLIVVGSHGRTGMARLLVGSVAARVVAHAACPVLVAR